MDPFEAFKNRIREALEANLAEIATEMANNLRQGVEKLPGTCRHTPLMRDMGLVDGTGKPTANGIRAYNALSGYYSRMDAETRKQQEIETRERRMIISPGYVSITGKQIPPLPYDPGQLESD